MPRRAPPSLFSIDEDKEVSGNSPEPGLRVKMDRISKLRHVYLTLIREINDLNQLPNITWQNKIPDIENRLAIANIDKEKLKVDIKAPHIMTNINKISKVCESSFNALKIEYESSKHLKNKTQEIKSSFQTLMNKILVLGNNINSFIGQSKFSSSELKSFEQEIKALHHEQARLYREFRAVKREEKFNSPDSFFKPPFIKELSDASQSANSMLLELAKLVKDMNQGPSTTCTIL